MEGAKASLRFLLANFPNTIFSPSCVQGNLTDCCPRSWFEVRLSLPRSSGNNTEFGHSEDLPQPPPRLYVFSVCLREVLLVGFVGFCTNRPSSPRPSSGEHKLELCSQVSARSLLPHSGTKCHVGHGRAFSLFPQ